MAIFVSGNPGLSDRSGDTARLTGNREEKSSKNEAQTGGFMERREDRTDDEQFTRGIPDIDTNVGKACGLTPVAGQDDLFDTPDRSGRKTK